MNKYFVPHEQANKLKELGFNEPCMGYYIPNDLRFICLVDTNIIPLEGDTYEDLDDFVNSETFVLAPLYAQAFEWFRGKGLFGEVEHGIGKFFFGIWDNGDNKIHKTLPHFPFDTYEEAELTCLKKMIEIYKTSKP
jgi:hypothetical protein